MSDYFVQSGPVVGSFPPNPFKLMAHRYITDPEKTFYSYPSYQWDGDGLYQEEREWYSLRGALGDALDDAIGDATGGNLSLPDLSNENTKMWYVHRLFMFRKKFMGEPPAVQLSRRPINIADEEALYKARASYRNSRQENAWNWLCSVRGPLKPGEQQRTGLEKLLDRSVIPPSGKFSRMFPFLIYA